MRNNPALSLRFLVSPTRSTRTWHGLPTYLSLLKRLQVYVFSGDCIRYLII